MRMLKNFLKMMHIFVFLSILTITNHVFSIEPEDRSRPISTDLDRIKQSIEELKNLSREITIDINKESVTKDSIALKELEPADVNSIEILRRDLFNGKMRWVNHSSYKNKQVIKGFLNLCRKAEKYNGSHTANWFLDTNYILVINLKNNKTLEIPYSLDLNSPLGEQFELQELCEALCAMTNGFKGSMIHFDQGKIINVKKISANLQRSDDPRAEVILPVPEFKNILKMDDEGKLSLTIEKRLDGKVIMNETKPFHYGQAQIFNHDGPGHMIVYIERPSDEF